MTYVCFCCKQPHILKCSFFNKLIISIMKESIIKVVLNFSFILPGSSQFINKDWHKGISFSFSAVAGLLMFIFGGEKVALLGFLIILLTWATNFMDVLDQVLKPMFRDLHEIAVSLERIADKLEIVAIQLKQIAEALPEIKTRLAMLSEERKFLPPPKQFLLLPFPRGGKVIFLPPVVKKKS